MKKRNRKNNKKNNSAGKSFFSIPVLTAALLCACSLSGCSAAMQSLADGTDTVLNGLADSTDIMMDGLADGTDTAMNALADGAGQMLDSLTEADDGRLKDLLLEAYGTLLNETGSAALTPEWKLKGRLDRGADDYTGSYEADYSGFTGTELLFGGTALEREDGGTLNLTCTLSLENGNAAVFLCSGSDEPVVLLSESGTYACTVEADGASTYIGVWGEHADGRVSVEVE